MNDKLPIVEVQRTYDSKVAFGGTSDDALKENQWVPCGEPKSLIQIINGDEVVRTSVEFEYSYGDTYY